jgi:hypothetical protein
MAAEQRLKGVSFLQETQQVAAGDSSGILVLVFN